MEIKKLVKSFKDQFIMLVGSNLIGLLSLIFALLLLYIGNKGQYNLYTSYTSIFAVFLVPSKLIKSLATTYGLAVFDKVHSFYNKLNRNKYWLLLFFLVYLILVYFITVYIKGTYFTTAFLILTAVSQIILQVFIGIIQNRKKFFESSMILIIQSIGKIILALVLFYFVLVNGIWFAFFMVSVITNFFLINNFRKKYQDRVNKTNSKIFNSDILINLFLLMSLELLFNFDAILASTKLNANEAYIYNSLVLVKKTLFFSVFGLTQIVLAESRKIETKKINSLIKNLLITVLVSVAAAIVFILFKNIIFKIINLDINYMSFYIKFIFTSILFSVLFMIGTWFTSFRNKFIRISLSLFILFFVFYYFQVVKNLENMIDIFIWGNIVLIAIQIGLGGVKYLTTRKL
ncbi:hypothetical protein GF362_02760 [Candidatus Dojkabacteria bacterium]|nr:hypothetical protein [Candidatus Dojkabacteria bacterium]